MTLPTPSPSLEPPPEVDSPLDTNLLTEEAKRGLVDALYSVRAPMGCLLLNEERLTLLLRSKAQRLSSSSGISQALWDSSPRSRP